MFATLSDRLADTFKNLRGKGRLSEADIDATAREIRTADRPGVVHRVLTTLAGLGLTVASAHVSTLGPQAVDVFYVQEVGGVRPTEERAAAAAHAVRTALGG